MKFIRSYQIFCFLRNYTIHRRKQFRTDRGIQHIHQHLRQLLVFCCVGIVKNQIPHQSLRHGTVDCIHGHMVPIVSCPSQRQFRHISGSNNHSIILVRQIHQNLSSFSCLRILISYVMHILIMSDIFKMLSYGFFDPDLFQRSS